MHELTTLRGPAAAAFLPGRDVALAWRALETAELALWLLASCNARLLCVAIDPGEANARPVIVPWHGRSTLGPRLSTEMAAFPPVLAALERAALGLFEALRTRWPPYAVPRRVGVVTDGTGVAFSADEPWPLAPGWLARQGRGGGLTQILPFASPGTWVLPGTWGLPGTGAH